MSKKNLTREEETLADDLFLTLRDAFQAAICEVISERDTVDPAFHRALAADVRTAGRLDEEDLARFIDDEMTDRALKAR